MGDELDFSSLGGAGGKPGRVALPEANDALEREWLKVFETLPSQLLNVYGRAAYVDMEDSAVWKELNKPLKSGAKYMSELVSPDDERKGIGLNRWLQVAVAYVEYQKEEKVKLRNQAILKEKMFEEVYNEVERVLPSLKFCLASKKYVAKQGAASLRSSTSTQNAVSEKDPADLDKHAKVVFEWLNPERPSRIRMLAQYQGAGGLSHCMETHHRAVRCFVQYGGSTAQGSPQPVTLAHFQRCVKARHSMNPAPPKQSNSKDTDFA